MVMAQRRLVASYVCVAVFTLFAYHNLDLEACIAAAKSTEKQQIAWLSNSTTLLSNSSNDKTLKVPTLTVQNASISTERNDTNSTSRNDEFLPENLGPPRRVPCGVNKCFYHLTSNRSVGYLVDAEKESDRFKTLQAGWQLAKRLEADFKIQHFLLAPPTKLRVSKWLANRLNRNLFIEQSRKMLDRKKSIRYPRGSTVFIQKVKLAPKRHLLIGCVKTKVQAFNRDMPRFLSYVQDKELFARNLNASLASTKSLVQNETCLIKDFQVLLDTKGRVYHLDFDRCFKSSGRMFRVSDQFTKSCFESLHKMKWQLLRAALPDGV